MKAYVIDKDITLPDLSSRLRNDAEEPEADGDHGEILVDVYSSALNFFDILQIQGKYQIKKPHPFTLGAEFAGIINEKSPIPEGCDWIPGKTRVFGMANGAYGERASADWTNVREIPNGISFEQASGLFVTWPTSYAALKFRANVQPDEWVLVHAGAGGVGLSAIQIAKALGAKVIATAGSAEKLKVCIEQGGADEVVNYRDKDWQQQVKDKTDGGVDVVYDPVGMIIPSLKFIKWNGRIVVVGFAAGTIEKIPANLILLKQISVMGVFWGAHIANEPERIPEAWKAIFDLLESKKCKPTAFDKIYDGLETLPQALKDLQDRKTWGKVVVRLRADPLFPPKGSSKL
ncbi:NAD(P)-binding protein [Meira miltonrushii]|uniref:NAD(P)-binding protein n=1 Tax=Meira miltonrushii TaxID=1280837 RepID=A0A316V9U7_9BASI|nr:NAD(P)-binding protein [Meira miltonrushii]PWN34242.1 NAD(P)-binding protein [Meira miltonrushii]